MPKLSIIQPGKIGDIIIMLPVAKWYSDLGYHVIWPIQKSYLEIFRNTVPYVEFIGINKILYGLAKEKCEKVDKYVDTYFGFSDKKDLTEKWKRSGKTFDVYKYELSEVPFEQKNNLVIKRDFEKEKWLYDAIISNKGNNYLLVHDRSSCGRRDIPIDGDFDHVVKITEFTRSVFDWLLVIEKAKEYRMIDSCFVTMVSQMGFSQPGIRYWKPNLKLENHYAILGNNWKTVQ